MTMLQYARFYESIFTMSATDKPTDLVIEDDEALDAWYKKYTREIAIKVAQMSGKQNNMMPMDDGAKQRVIHKFGGGADAAATGTGDTGKTNV